MILASVKMGQRGTRVVFRVVEVAKRGADEDNGPDRLDAKRDLMRFMEGGS